jgi:hypothetical protein
LPNSIALGRIDGDAFPDAVVASYSGVSVLTNNGAGGLGPAVLHPLHNGGFGIELADLDGDGDLDVVCGGTYSQELDVLLGTGTGGFAAPFRVPLDQSPTSLAIADVDGDGALDLIAACGDVELCFGDGSGGFGPPQCYLPFATAANAADMNGDGRLDLVAVGGGMVSLQHARPRLEAYCTAGVTTHGCVPTLTSSGVASASAGSGFDVWATNVEGQKQGLLFYGLSGALALPWGTGTSTLCVKPPTQRTLAQSSGGSLNGCDGVLSLDWNAFTSSPSALGSPFAGGESVCIQAWLRDPPSPKTTNLSNALRFVVQP